MTGPGAEPTRRPSSTPTHRVEGGEHREAARKLSRHRAVRRLYSLPEIAQRSKITVAFCWSHLRREIFKIAERGDAPLATEAVARIAQIYAIEKDVRGTSADQRCAARQIRSRPRHRTGYFCD